MTPILTLFAKSCSDPKLFSLLPTWYEYLPRTNCAPALHSITDVWLIVAAITEILLRIATLAAIAFVIYGGILYATSQGGDQTTQARNTIVNALIGLVLSISAGLIIAFLATRF